MNLFLPVSFNPVMFLFFCFFLKNALCTFFFTGSRSLNFVSYFVFSGDKPVILVLMHHTRDVDFSTDVKKWSETYQNVVLDVHVLFHETQPGLLKCPRNDEAVHQIQTVLKAHSRSWFGWLVLGLMPWCEATSNRTAVINNCSQINVCDVLWQIKSSLNKQSCWSLVSNTEVIKFLILLKFMKCVLYNFIMMSSCNHQSLSVWKTGNSLFQSVWFLSHINNNNNLLLLWRCL